MNPAPLPLAIDMRPWGLHLSWSDGGIDLGAADLRAACRCRDCRTAALRGAPHKPVPNLRLTDALPVGRYALQLRFSDGHDRGIYPWVLLRDLSPSTALR